MDKQFFYEMLKTDSVSGDEIKLQKKVLKHYQAIADQQLTDETGNVINVINPNSPVKVLMSGHIDEIGLVVTGYTADGFLKVTNAGGIYVSSYLGHQVVVHTANKDLYGVVVCTRSLSKKSDLAVGDLSVDIGVSNKQQAEDLVKIGDTITFDTHIREMQNGKISARAIDDRGGAFIILEALKKAKEKGCQVGAYASTSVGEETTMRGAYFAAARVNPTMAIIVDVTYTSDYPGVNDYDSGHVELGKGPVLCCSSIVNKKMNQKLKDIAQELKIPYQIETFVGRTGTDADKIHLANQGIPVCLVSLPLRYMHTPSETCHEEDIQNSIDLIAEFLCQIDEGFDLNPFS